MTKRRPLALGAAAALGLGSLFLASPALAEDTGVAEAPITQDPAALASAAVAQIQTATADEESVVGYGTTTDGEPIVLVDEAYAGNAEIAEIAEALPVDKIALVGKAVADASTDVVGGAGYLGDLGTGDGRVGICSVGFTGWSADGDPALISAGHCTSDGAITDVMLTKPSTEPANGGSDAELDVDGNGIVGTFGFSQFGGPGNTEGVEDDPSSTDISVIDVTNDGLALHPEVTDWTTAGQDDLAASATPIKGVADPVSGTVSKSGRTTGVTTGSTVLNLPVEHQDGTEGVEPVEILDGYLRVSGRWVHGFLGGALTDHGDSGGAVFQGDQAVGVVSGGPEDAPEQGDDWAWYTRLADALELTGGYEVALDIDAPKVTSHSDGATVEPGTAISGTVADNATDASVSFQPNSGAGLPLDGKNFSFDAPEEEGDYTASLVASNGHSSSDATEFHFTVEKGALAAPTVNDVDTTDSTVAVTGTGAPGATVDVTIGDETKTATVGEDGTWSVDFDLAIGAYEASASQTLDGETSGRSQTASVTVRPTAPAFTSPAPGASIPNDDSPSAISGTGVAGAALELNDGAGNDAAALVADASSNVVVGDDGAWTVDLGGALGAGTYAYTATQVVNGVASEAAQLSFTVEAAAAPGPGQPGPGEPGQPGPENPGGELPLTGSDVNLLPYGISAAVMLLIGGAAVLLVARRARAEEA